MIAKKLQTKLTKSNQDLKAKAFKSWLLFFFNLVCNLFVNGKSLKSLKNFQRFLEVLKILRVVELRNRYYNRVDSFLHVSTDQLIA